jgi:hypothetical protein
VPNPQASKETNLGEEVKWLVFVAAMFSQTSLPHSHAQCCDVSLPSPKDKSVCMQEFTITAELFLASLAP